MSYVIAALIIGKGISFIKANSYRDKRNKKLELLVPYGILNILYAILIVVNIFTLKVDLNIVVGFYVIATALIFLYYIFNNNKVFKQIKVLLSVILALSIILGVILMANILTDILFFSSICGIVLIFYSMLNYMGLLLIKRNEEINIDKNKNKKKKNKSKSK